MQRDRILAHILAIGKFGKKLKAIWPKLSKIEQAKIVELMQKKLSFR